MSNVLDAFRSILRVRSHSRTLPPTNSRLSTAALCPRRQPSPFRSSWNRSQECGLHNVDLESQRRPPDYVEPPSHSDLHRASRTEFRSRISLTPTIPQLCPGCGALSQDANPNDAGYYSRSRKSVKSYLKHRTPALPNAILTSEVERLSKDLIDQDEAKSRLDETNSKRAEGDGVMNGSEVPVCDRCHNLIYNNQGTSIAHPTLEDLADSIAESPFRRNHIYHVLDAADFPMSLVPKIFSTLEVARLRGQNRRARTKFTTKSTISFIITRSDLLGPSKEMVDKMMPYFQDTLRSALGRQARNTRLGNVHLVSAKRGWWTKELKDDIWERGGGNWMVGKVNVGKSNLFPVLFPKGSGERAPVYSELQECHHENHSEPVQDVGQGSYLQEDSMLPPAQPEVPFPAMPVVSHLPGTTASPIRLSFGQHKGELIDLPGLDRGSLEEHVHPDHKLDLVMQYRPNVKQHVIKPGQSLLLGGGIVRITPQLDPQDPSMTMLAYPFVPLDAHVTATEKAIAIQQQQRESGVKSILADGTGLNISSSGTYALTTDVTKIRASSLLRAGVPLAKLPFRVFSSDILIEGVGWVELVCQVHNSQQTKQSDTQEVLAIDATRTMIDGELSQELTSTANQQESGFKPFLQQRIDDPEEPKKRTPSHPTTEIFSPHGKHIGQRKSLGVWMLWERTRSQGTNTKSNVRPRKSMKGSKKRAKAEQQGSTSSS